MKRGARVGSGTYGIVYNAWSPTTHRELAIKRNLKEHKVSFISSLRELDLLAKLGGHPHVVSTQYVSFGAPFVDAALSPLNAKEHKSQTDDNIHFVFERATCDFGSRVGPRAEAYSFADAKRYMAHLLLAAEFLHERRIIHRDIKPTNLLFFAEVPDAAGAVGLIKLCDFGLAKPYTLQGSETPCMVTSLYRAPEIILGDKKYDFKVDMWSVGCTIYEMVARRPFISVSSKNYENDEVLFKAIVSRLPVKLTEDELNSLGYEFGAKNARSRRVSSATFKDSLALSPAAARRFEQEAGPLDRFCDFLARLLTFWPDKRSSAREALEHPFFDDCRPLIAATREQAAALFSAPDPGLPTLPWEAPLEIVPCLERTWALQASFDVYATMAGRPRQWYKHRILFQAIDVFDRYLLALRQAEMAEERDAAKEGREGREDKAESQKPRRAARALVTTEKGRFHTRNEALQRFYVCLYLATKYFTSIQYVAAFSEIAPASFRRSDGTLFAEQFELGLVKNCLNYSIYRPTVYEALDHYGAASEADQEKAVNELLTIFGRAPPDKYSGRYPSQIVAQYKKEGLASFDVILPKP